MISVNRTVEMANVIRYIDLPRTTLYACDFPENPFRATRIPRRTDSGRVQSVMRRCVPIVVIKVRWPAEGSCSQSGTVAVLQRMKSAKVVSPGRIGVEHSGAPGRWSEHCGQRINDRCGRKATHINKRKRSSCYEVRKFSRSSIVS